MIATLFDGMVLSGYAWTSLVWMRVDLEGARMQYYDALKRAADAAGLSLSQVSERINRNPNYIANNISIGNSPSVDNAILMMGACGYSIVAVPEGDEPEGCLAISPSPASVDAERAARERKREKLLQQLEELY